MGHIWKAHHLTLNIPCALKFVAPELAGNVEAFERFEHEARTAAQVRNPHVVQILDYGDSVAGPYIAMELLDGEDLGARLEREGRIPPFEMVVIVGHVARALTKAHHLGLIHRDLKPENVFLTKDDGLLMAKVLDFGVAKSQGRVSTGTTTQAGALVGSPYFMSPEQAHGNLVLDHRTDVWALGVLAFTGITGEFPFKSDGIGELMMKIIVEPAPLPSSIVADLPPAFDAWWRKATDKDIDKRFQSAKDLARALARAFGAADSVGDEPSNLDGETAKSRRKVIGVFGGIGVLMLAIGIAATGLLIQQSDGDGSGVVPPASVTTTSAPSLSASGTAPEATVSARTRPSGSVRRGVKANPSRNTKPRPNLSF